VENEYRRVGIAKIPEEDGIVEGLDIITISVV